MPDKGWRDLGFRKRDEIYWRIVHRINFWLHPEYHRLHCTCQGSGIWT